MQSTAIPGQEHGGFLKYGIGTGELEPDPGFAYFAAEQHRHFCKGSAQDQRLAAQGGNQKSENLQRFEAPERDSSNIVTSKEGGRFGDLSLYEGIPDENTPLPNSAGGEAGRESSKDEKDGVRMHPTRQLQISVSRESRYSTHILCQRP